MKTDERITEYLKSRRASFEERIKPVKDGRGETASTMQKVDNTAINEHANSYNPEINHYKTVDILTRCHRK